MPRHHLEIVEGVDEGQAALNAQGLGEGVGVIIGLALQDHFRAEVAGVLDLHHRRAAGHDDGRRHAQLGGVIGEALRVIACAGGDHADIPAGLIHQQELVQRAALLESGGELQILELHPHVCASDLGQGAGVAHRRALDPALEPVCGGDDILEAQVRRAMRRGGGLDGTLDGHGIERSSQKGMSGDAAAVMNSPERRETGCAGQVLRSGATNSRRDRRHPDPRCCARPRGERAGDKGGNGEDRRHRNSFAGVAR